MKALLSFGSYYHIKTFFLLISTTIRSIENIDDNRVIIWGENVITVIDIVKEKIVQENKIIN